jgi:hypothetical protein
VRLTGDPQAAYLGPQFGLDSRVSQETASQVDAETRRLVEEALGEASALLSLNRTTLDRLAGRLCDQETVNGSEVTAMLAEAAAPKDAGTGPDPNGWYFTGQVDAGEAAKAASGNGHEPQPASSVA